MLIRLLLCAALALLAVPAFAQAPVELCVRATPTGFCQAVNSTTPLPVTGAGSTAMTTAGCTVGAASAQCLAASIATRWIQVQNTHATNGVACSWGGTAVLNSSGSFMLAAGQSASWGVMTSGVPTNALNCIASGAATPLYLEYR